MYYKPIAIVTLLFVGSFASPVPQIFPFNMGQPAIDSILGVLPHSVQDNMRAVNQGIGNVDSLPDIQQDVSGTTESEDIPSSDPARPLSQEEIDVIVANVADTLMSLNNVSGEPDLSVESVKDTTVEANGSDIEVSPKPKTEIKEEQGSNAHTKVKPAKEASPGRKEDSFDTENNPTAEDNPDKIAGEAS